MGKLTTILLVAASLSLVARNLYVNNQTGNDQNDGLSPERAWKTLATAAPKLQPGDVLHLAPGTYYESFKMVNSGTPQQPIVIQGNNAVLSGLKPVPDDSWQKIADNLYHSPNTVRTDALRPRVFNAQNVMICIPKGTPETLKPGQALWNAKGIYVRTRDNVHPKDMKLKGFYRVSGVIYTGQSYITVNNLIAENFANDGFNVHGYCRGLVFNNIVGRWNGDDGFSIHEDVMACVYGAHLHHNDYGVQDINLSRSFFSGMLVEDNRICGLDLCGGLRSVEDTLVRNNANMQIRLVANHADHMCIPRNNPLLAPTVYLKNVLVTGGNGHALVLGSGSKAAASKCTFLNTDTGIQISKDATLHLYQSIVSDTKRLNINNNGTFVALANTFFPGTAVWHGEPLQGYALLEKINVNGASNVTAKPGFNKHYAAAYPHVFMGKSRVAPGFNPGFTLPFIPETPAELDASNTPVVHDYDFETTNPWSRTFIEPQNLEKTVQHSSTLSTKQAASGKSSAKVHAIFPKSDKTRTYILKLFTVKFHDVKKPVTSWTFKMFCNNDNVTFHPRVRDKQGEYFFSTRQTTNWSGWKTIHWDLTKNPPNPVLGGNKIQDCPPIELVIDFYITVPPEGRTFTVFLDDLSFK